MPEQSKATTLPNIARNQSTGEKHPLADQSQLDRVSHLMEGVQDMVPLAIYLKDIAGKPRGTEGGNKDLNSHFEEFIVKEGGEIKVTNLAELQEKLAAVGVSDLEILGVESVGNANQKVSAVVQGVNRNNPQSGYERPAVAEGPHMILAPYALDRNGNMHVFRTIQYRTGEAVIDTPRGFADQKSLETGQQMYDVEGAGSRVEANLKRIVGEEAGKRLLDIKRIVYLGAPRVNTSFVTARSAFFGVEVDYDNFIQSNKVITEEEAQRRKEQLDHEGLMGVILDMNVDQYVNYKRDSSISRDMAADSGTDTVVIDFLANRLEDYKATTERRSRQATNLGYAVKFMGEGMSKKDAVKKALDTTRNKT